MDREVGLTRIQVQFLIVSGLGFRDLGFRV